MTYCDKPGLLFDTICGNKCEDFQDKALLSYYTIYYQYIIFLDLSGDCEGLNMIKVGYINK